MDTAFVGGRDESELCRGMGCMIPLPGDGMDDTFMGGHDESELCWEL